MSLEVNAGSILRPPFAFRHCLLTECPGLSERIIGGLQANGIQVLGVIDAWTMGAPAKLDGIPRFARNQVTADGFPPDLPVLLAKVEGWPRLKSELKAVGFTTFAFIEDLFLPRATWTGIFQPLVDNFVDDMAYAFAETDRFPRPSVTAAVKFALALAREHEIGCNGFGPADLSMVNPIVPILAAAFLHLTPGLVIEVGAFVGGLTCSLGLAARALGQSVLSFEPGGSGAHAKMATGDILADLRTNLAVFGLGDVVTVVPSGPDRWRPDPAKRFEALIGRTMRRSAVPRLMVIDADGKVIEHLRRFADVIPPGCFLIVDDFMMDGPQRLGKGASVRRDLHDLIATGAVEELWVVPWGTWLGRIRAPDQLGNPLCPPAP